jgi:hypothetical protein
MNVPAGADDTSAPAPRGLGHIVAVTASALDDLARIATSAAGLVLLVQQIRRRHPTCHRSTP